MAWITLSEIAGMILLTFILGFLFSGMIPRPERSELILKKKWFSFEDIKYAALIAAPAVLFHELGHKFIGLLFGLTAVFKVFWFGLGIGLVLRLINSPFLILAPAYVELSGTITPLSGFFTAFAGPFINLLLFFIAFLVLRYKKHLSFRQASFLAITKKINLVLFIFNMIPFPPLDGSKVFYYLFQIL